MMNRPASSPQGERSPVSEFVPVPVLIVLLILALKSAMAPGPVQAAQSHSVVAPPACTNNKGEAVRFLDTDKGRPGVATGMARRDASGEPVVLRSNFSATPPAFQRFIDLHECAHHQTGDVDRPHPPRNGPEHLMNESVSDCIAILRLRDEDGYDEAGLDSVSTVLRSEMAKIGFPEISISSRLSNIENCYRRPGSPDEFIGKILKKRGL